MPFWQVVLSTIMIRRNQITNLSGQKVSGFGKDPAYIDRTIISAACGVVVRRVRSTGRHRFYCKGSGRRHVREQRMLLNTHVREQKVIATSICMLENPAQNPIGQSETIGNNRNRGDKCALSVF